MGRLRYTRKRKERRKRKRKERRGEQMEVDSGIKRKKGWMGGGGIDGIDGKTKEEGKG